MLTSSKLYAIMNKFLTEYIEHRMVYQHTKFLGNTVCQSIVMLIFQFDDIIIIYAKNAHVSKKNAPFWFFLHNALDNNEYYNCAKFQVTGVNQSDFMLGVLQQHPPGLNYPPNSPA